MASGRQVAEQNTALLQSWVASKADDDLRQMVRCGVLDEKLRKLMGHKDIKTTLEYYVHLVNRFIHDYLLIDLKRAQVARASAPC